MNGLRYYSAALIVPPLLVALPAAIAFAAHVTRMPGGLLVRVAAVAAVAYAAGGALAAVAMRRAVAHVSADLAAQRDPSDSLSKALADTTLSGALLWIGWGMVISMTACALIAPTFLGLQYFAEAALLVAAPAMAWSYWLGKHLLLRAARLAPRMSYTGRPWSFGTKIAIVFIGFFVVSTGALVLVISSRVALRIGDEMAYEIARFGLVIAVITTAVFAVATWFLARDISAPTAELVHLAGEMAEGRFSVEPRVFSDDEIGHLARSFAVTRTNLRQLVGQVGERGQAIFQGVTAMSAGTDSLVDNVHEQSGMAVQSSSALRVVQEQAQSVLREVERVTELTYDSAGRATELRTSFTEVAGRMDELFQSVEKSSSAATQIDAAARETVNRTTSLAGISSDLLAFVSQMDATTEQVTRSAQSTAALSENVREKALAGRTAVEATVEGIRTTREATLRTSGAFAALQQSLGRIDEILLFIDEVTNRTNLLSLNAAIIAAQAGQNDYGFSVIADEVRQLADRTRNATKEIAAVIRGVQPVALQAVDALQEGMSTVERTVGLAQKAAESLETILGSADRSLDMTRSISHSLQEQMKASRHLHEVTARMSDDIVETRRATEGQAVATRMLAFESERVRDIALQVKSATGEQTGTADGIAGAMEQVANDVASIRDRLDRQLQQAEQVADASRLTLTIAERNNSIAEEFRGSLQSLLSSGRELESEVSRFR